MSKQMISFNDLKDSRLLYDKKIPNFGYFIIIFMLILIAIIILWSIRTYKIDIIKSNGTVQSTNKTMVMPIYSGIISNYYMEEGKTVEKGDVLFSIKSTELDLQTKQLEGKKSICLSEIKQLEKLRDSIKDNTNYFEESNDKDSLYYFQYKNYQSQIAQNKLDTTAYKSYGHSDEQIEKEIIKNQSKISEIYYSTLKGVEDSILSYKNEISSIDIQLNAVGSGKEEYIVTASETGKLHMLGDYKEGTFVQAGSPVAAIAAEKDEYKIQAYLSAENRPKVTTGDKVDIAVSGLSQGIYGTITGTLVKIDSDITFDKENNAGYFKADISPDSKYIISKDGYKVNLFNGMSVEVRIHYDQVTYFNYFLEGLGLLTR